MSSLAHPAPSASATGITKCPLCASGEQKVVSEYGGQSLRTCLHCAGSYVFPAPSAEQIAAHFVNGERLDAIHLERKFERNRERVLARVAGYVRERRKRGTILDVGCATGLFLARYFNHPEWQSWGLELSPGAAASAAGKGIQVCCGDIHQARLADSSVDVITVLDAFYYFPRPQLELAEFRRVLKSDGLLVLEFPLASSRIWRTSRALGRLLTGSRRPLLESSDHLFYYTPKSIAALLESCGFRVDTILPLPGNRQADFPRDLAFKAYWAFSRLLCFLSRSKLFLGPRFLVAAGKVTESQAAAQGNLQSCAPVGSRTTS